MRVLIVAIAFAAALVAAAPASAQRMSLADRVALLEQRAADNRVSMDLLNQVSELRAEVQALRALVEELQQQNEQLRASSRTQYLDLDGRLNRLEGGMPAAPGEGTVGAAAPRVHGDPGLLANAADERSAYEQAFDALKSGDYVASADLFLAFLQAYPEGVYAPNARYWLGESYYVTQNYEMAREQFEVLV